MAFVVCAGAKLQCSFGQAPSNLAVLPPAVQAGVPVANIMDFAPMTNILPFGACSSLANPAVAAATAAALGALTPQPCVPQTVAPWTPGGPPKVTARKLPVVVDSDQLLCLWGGVIRVIAAGQTKALVK
jgi:hypothetical protein